MARLTVAAALLGLLVLAWSEQTFGSLSVAAGPFGNPTYSSLFDKPKLGPGRVLAFLCLAIGAYRGQLTIRKKSYAKLLS